MAMAPTPTAAPAAAGADPTMAGGAPPDDMGAADDAGSPPVLLTVLGPAEGPYILVSGDEPEGEGDMAADAPKFDTGPALVKAIMQLLNPSKGADDAFDAGFKGGKGGDTAPMPSTPMPG